MAAVLQFQYSTFPEATLESLSEILLQTDSTDSSALAGIIGASAVIASNGAIDAIGATVSEALAMLLISTSPAAIVKL